MGNPKQKWKEDEEAALMAGVAKHGAGKWKSILTDEEFRPFLSNRTNIDLKDKWRNMNVSTNSRQALKAKANYETASPAAIAAAAAAAGAAAASASQNTQSRSPPPAAADPVRQFTAEDLSARPPPKKKTDPPLRYNDMIIEAITSLNEPNGSESAAIMGFIMKKDNAPPNFGRQFSSRLGRLVTQEKIEKVENRYRLKTGPPSRKKKSSSIDVSFTVSRGSDPGEKTKLAALDAAYSVAEAENKSFLAAEAVKEAESVAEMAEETGSLLQLAKEIFERCSQGEVVLVA